MDRVLNFITDHPLSTSFAFAQPMVIPSEYHSVFAQLILTLGTQIVLFLAEKLNKKRVKANLEKREKEPPKDGV